MRKRQNIVYVRMNDEEYELLKKKLEQTKLTLQSYIINSSLNAKVPTADEVNELKKLNQLYKENKIDKIDNLDDAFIPFNDDEISENTSKNLQNPTKILKSLKFKLLKKFFFKDKISALINSFIFGFFSILHDLHLL